LGVPASHRGHKIQFDIGDLNRTMVLQNDMVFGSVNAKRRHDRDAANALGRADRGWLTALISRRVPLRRRREAFEPRDNDIKVLSISRCRGRHGIPH
jgi:hypothetical protein